MNTVLLLILLLLLAGCKEKYLSPVPRISTGYLVVEGVVNDGGQTNIRLSRTTSLADTSRLNEQGAVVTLEDSLGAASLLQENVAGTYTVEDLHLNALIPYRLVIKTANGETYQSDLVKVRYNPPIDSINWVRDINGVQLFINTHNANNDTRYYQWEFYETWEFHSPFTASLKWLVKPGPDASEIWSAVNRDASDPEISKCWQFNNSNTIVLGSSAKLLQDMIHLPLIQIPNASLKLTVLYSVLVRQYAWSKEGYNFLQRMKKNTESVGSVFDAQPSELNGNIHCITNKALPVIGFFNICSIREQRIFIKNSELPDWNYRSGCFHTEIPNISDSIKAKAIGKLPVDPILIAPGGFIVTLHVSDAECVDCTLSGTNQKPDYWP